MSECFPADLDPRSALRTRGARALRAGLGLALVVGTFGFALQPAGAEALSDDEAQSLRVQNAAAFLREGTLAQYRISTIGFGLNAAAAALFVGVALLRRRRGLPWRSLGLPRWGRVALVALAALQVLANLNFVVRASPHGFHASDMFHYAFGSKYFPEVGYFDLYLCSAAAATQPGQGGTVVIRDLRSDRLEKLAVRSLPHDRCGGRFSELRWAEFERDVRWLRGRVGDAFWSQTLRDHGFNPSPLWTAIGRPIASLVPIGADGLRAAARLDWLLLAAAFGAAGWAFGLEAACLLALMWGGTGLNRYAWVGDSFLRQLWFGAAIVGLCLLRRRRFAGGGALLGAAAGFRLFPAVYAGGALLVQMLAALRVRAARGSRTPLLHTAAGALAAVLVLGGAGVIAGGRGLAVYPEFAANIGAFAASTAYNSVGLGPLVSYRAARPSTVVENGERIDASDQRYPQALLRQTRHSRRGLEWAVIALFVALFGRASLRPGARDWEIAAAGFALVPVLSQPPCYYVGLYAPAALLCVERPQLRWPVLGALLAWSGAQLTFYNQREEYVLGSAIALALAFAVLVALQRDPPLRA